MSFFKKPMLVGWLLMAVAGAQAAMYYVSPTGSDANNGTSWPLAKQTIQAAINVAASGDTVLVADGTYAPITIPPGITVRSVNGAQFTTIDGGGKTRCAYLYANAVLDGFTVTNGYSLDNGGGVYAAGGTVRNCTIRRNRASYGGGVIAWPGTVENCIISGNAATNMGGGVAVLYGSWVKACTISENKAAEGEGGGIAVWFSTVEGCTISGNTATLNGGGVWAFYSSVKGCTISGNTTATSGGGLTAGGTAVEDCTISENTAAVNGGGIAVRDNTVKGCTISGNTADWGGGIALWGYSTVKGCTIRENIAYFNGGGGLVFSGSVVENCMISGNTSYGSNWTINNYDCGGGVFIFQGGTVKDCTITKNMAYWDGGGAFVWGGTLENCTINGNNALSFGGGVTIINGTVKNCLISGNRADDTGGGVHAEGGVVESCTITRNTVFSESGRSGLGGGMYIQAGTVRNCIVYYNEGKDVMGPNTPCASYSCLGTKIAGTGNITNAPQFISAGTGYGTNLVPGNYRLQPTSPCINAGINQSWMMNAVDLDGRPRILGGVVDMGAYEWSQMDILIMRNPTILSNQCDYGSNAASQMIEVWNAGTNTMAYALSANVNWLSISPASGTSTGETDLVSVIYASAGLLPGAYTGIVTITSAQAINSPQVVTVYLRVDNVNQTITFPQISSQPVTGRVGLAATASSGLPVSFSVAFGSGTITGGTNMTFTAVGIVQVVASQAGNAIYNPAANVTNAVLVERAGQTITFPPIPIQVVTSKVGLAGTASSGLPVSFTIASGPGIISDEMNLTFTAVGTVYVVASQSGDVIWEAATPVTNVVLVTILPVGVIQFAETSKEVGEASGSISLSVERTGGSYGPASVEYATSDGTALAGADYTMQSGTLSWVDGEAVGKTITVSITDDIFDENNETFTVMLSDVQGANLGTADVAAVTILDNDEPPRGVLQLAVTSVEVNESGGLVTLTARRTEGSYGAASVEYLTTAGTATAELDYQTTQGTLSWADGEAGNKTITVLITDDSVDEDNEAFMVILSNVQGASLGPANVATVTILDNDEPPSEDLVDLEVTGFKFEPVNLWAGDHPAMISFDLVNDGPEDLVAPEAQLEINFYLSSNTTFGDGDDMAIGTMTEEITLRAGTQTTLRNPGRAHNTDVTIPEGLSGDYYVFVSVRLVSQSGLSDPDGASAMRDGPVRIRIHPSDDGDNPGDGDSSKQRNVLNDYDGDGQSDMMAYDETSGAWVIQLSASGASEQFVFGGPGYEAVPGDYDGDGKTDPAVHHKKGSQWHLMLSGLAYQTISFDFGAEAETQGAVGDYNGDGLADPGLYEEKSGRWSVLLPNLEHGKYEIVSALFGGPGYMPVAGDYDGDGRTDPGLYEEVTGKWRVMLSAKGYGVVGAVMGGPGYRPVPADYDGDGKSDPAVVSSSGGWYYRLSSRGYSLSGPDTFGKSGRPVPGDYDGDGKSDPAIMSATGGWYFWLSGSWYIRVGPYNLQ